MKLTKMTLIAALALGSLLTVGTSANAQTASTNAPAATTQTPPPGRGRMPGIDQLAKQLSLTDAQKTNVVNILAEQRKKMGELRQDTSLSMEDRRTKMKEIHDGVTAKMKEILTPDQFAQYEKMTPPRRNGSKPQAAPAASPSPN